MQEPKKKAMDKLTPEQQEKVRKLVANQLALDKLKQMASASKVRRNKT